MTLLILLLLSSAALCEPIRHLNRNAVTFETCQSTPHCAAPRNCIVTNSVWGTHAPCNSIFDQCVCAPSTIARCAANADCAHGETCTAHGFAMPICVGNKSMLRINSVVKQQRGTALTLEPCLQNADCIAPRLCLLVDATYQGSECGLVIGPCWCEPPIFKDCDNDGECENSEVCRAFTVFNNAGGVCVSFRLNDDDSSLVPVNEDGKQDGTVQDPKDVKGADVDREGLNESGEPAPPNTAESEVCIAVKHLQHLSVTGRVYSKDRKAWVLCDNWGNCATPGHVVWWKGRGMMMKRYCEQVGGCERNVEWVNSPRGWGVRVASNREGLQFSSLAARWVTPLEESVLAGLVRLGL